MDSLWSLDLKDLEQIVMRIYEDQGFQGDESYGWEKVEMKVKVIKKNWRNPSSNSLPSTTGSRLAKLSDS